MRDHIIRNMQKKICSLSCCSATAYANYHWVVKMIWVQGLINVAICFPLFQWRERGACVHRWRLLASVYGALEEAGCHTILMTENGNHLGGKKKKMEPSWGGKDAPDREKPMIDESKFRAVTSPSYHSKDCLLQHGRGNATYAILKKN